MMLQSSFFFLAHFYPPPVPLIFISMRSSWHFCHLSRSQHTRECARELFLARATRANRRRHMWLVSQAFAVVEESDDMILNGNKKKREKRIGNWLIACKQPTMTNQLARLFFTSLPLIMHSWASSAESEWEKRWKTKREWWWWRAERRNKSLIESRRGEEISEVEEACKPKQAKRAQQPKHKFVLNNRKKNLFCVWLKRERRRRRRI